MTDSETEDHVVIQFKSYINFRLDTLAKQHGFENIVEAVSFIHSHNSIDRQIAEILNKIRDDVRTQSRLIIASGNRNITSMMNAVDFDQYQC